LGIEGDGMKAYTAFGNIVLVIVAFWLITETVENG
jgi:hypothetical protein